MPQSLVQIYVHVVYSTKGRRRFLQNEALRLRIHASMAGICEVDPKNWTAV